MEETSLLYEVTSVILGFVGIALICFVGWLIGKTTGFIENRGVNIPDSLEWRARELAERAIGYGEEKARQLVKEKSEALPSAAKLEVAAKFFKEHAEGPLKKFGEDRIKSLIESELGVKRIRAETSDVS